MAKQTTKLNLESIDIYSTLFDEASDSNESEIIELPLSYLHEFKDHPFRVTDDESMYELAASIQEKGVIYPILVRPEEMDSYEIIAGHRRKRGCELAGRETIPCIILDITHNEAVKIMVYTNIQRPSISISEKAFAFRMEMEAARGEKESGRTDTYLAEKAGLGRSTIQRYIRLTYLNRKLLNMLDDGSMGITTGEALSYLRADEQEGLLRYMDINHISKISGEQAAALKEYSQNKRLDGAALKQIFFPDREKKRKVTLNSNTLSKYFPDDYSQDDMEQVIVGLLEDWMRRDGRVSV